MPLRTQQYRIYQTVNGGNRGEEGVLQVMFFFQVSCWLIYCTTSGSKNWGYPCLTCTVNFMNVVRPSDEAIVLSQFGKVFYFYLQKTITFLSRTQNCVRSGRAPRCYGSLVRRGDVFHPKMERVTRIDVWENYPINEAYSRKSFYVNLTDSFRLFPVLIVHLVGILLHSDNVRFWLLLVPFRVQWKIWTN